MRVAVGLTLVLALTSCSRDRGDVSAGPEPSVQLQPSAQPQPSAGTAIHRQSSVSKERSSPPTGEYDFERFRGATGRAYALKHAAVICSEPCYFPEDSEQHVWLVRDGLAQPADELWPGSGWSNYAGPMKQEKLATRVTFLGDYPEGLFAYGAVETRSGEGNLPLVKWEAGKWQRDHREIPYEEAALPPREYDAALLSAPTGFNPRTSFAYGAGGPTLTSDRGELSSYDGKRWQTKSAPWSSAVQLTRLADGSTLALNDAAWLVSAKGDVTPLMLEQNHAEKSVVMNGEAWIYGRYILSKPSTPGRFKVAELPARVKARPVKESGKVANPTPFSAQCKTPAVLLQHPDGTALYPHELPALFVQDSKRGAGWEAYVVDYEFGERHVIQAKDRAAAQRVLEIAKRLSSLSGELQCSDLHSLLPDAYARTQHLRRVFVHARSGVGFDLT